MSHVYIKYLGLARTNILTKNRSQVCRKRIRVNFIICVVVCFNRFIIINTIVCAITEIRYIAINLYYTKVVIIFTEITYIAIYVYNVGKEMFIFEGLKICTFFIILIYSI